MSVLFVRHTHVGILSGNNIEIGKNHSYNHSSMILQPFVGPWTLFQFRNLFYTVGRTP
jgi:hypothetical protein